METETNSPKIAKFTGSAEMEIALDKMAAAVNDGFSGGRVTKHDLVSWVVLYFEKNCLQECVDRIRQDHFDQVAYLESVLKQAKQARKSGGLGPDMATLLAPLARPGKPERLRPRQMKLGHDVERGGASAMNDEADLAR